MRLTNSLHVLMKSVITWRHAIVNNLGFYPAALALPLRKQLEQVRTTLQDSLSAAEREAQRNQLDEVFRTLQEEEESASLNMPKVSQQTERHGYSFCTPLRGNRYPTAKGANQPLVGEEYLSANKLPHGCFACAKTELSISRMPLTDCIFRPTVLIIRHCVRLRRLLAKGWTLKPSNELGYFIITSGTVQFNQTNNSGQGFHIYQLGWRNEYFRHGMQIPDYPCI